MEALLDQAARFVVDVAAVIVTPIVVGILVRWLQRVGIELGAERRARLEKIVHDVVLGVEEWAAARAKRGAPADSTAKLHEAISRILARVPGVSDEEARALIHEALPRLGLGATDFLRRARAAVQTPDSGAP